MLRGNQIDPERSHPGPVLRWRASASWEWRSRDMPADAAPPLRSMLAHNQTHRWQVEHLTRLLTDRLAIGQIPAAAMTCLRHMHDHLVGLLNTLKMTTLMAGLAARLAARPAPQTLRCRRLGQPVRRRRPRGVPRVLRQLPLQISDLGPQLHDQRRLLNNQRLKLLPRQPHKGHTTRFATPPLPPTTT